MSMNYKLITMGLLTTTSYDEKGQSFSQTGQYDLLKCQTAIIPTGH
jgi:hypothetical protein